MIAAEDPRHGSTAGYTGGCHLTCCRAAVAAYKREYIRKAKKNPLPPNDPRHGKASTYTNYGCACERCRDAWTIHHREYMHADPARLEKHAARQRDYVARKRAS